MTALRLATGCIVGGHRPPLQRKAANLELYVQSQASSSVCSKENSPPWPRRGIGASLEVGLQFYCLTNRPLQLTLDINVLIRYLEEHQRTNTVISNHGQTQIEDLHRKRARDHADSVGAG